MKYLTRLLKDEKIHSLTNKTELINLLNHKHVDDFIYLNELYTMVNYDAEGKETVYTSFDCKEDIIVTFADQDKNKNKVHSLEFQDTTSLRTDLVYLSKIHDSERKLYNIVLEAWKKAIRGDEDIEEYELSKVATSWDNNNTDTITSYDTVLHISGMAYNIGSRLSLECHFKDNLDDALKDNSINYITKTESKEIDGNTIFSINISIK